jgi:acyl carrier protein phosphodiesterase
MYKTLELNQKQMLEVFRSMGTIRQILDPVVLSEVNLNFETVRNSLQVLAYNFRAMEEDREILMPTILELVLYEIDQATLPESVPQDVRDQIPQILLFN